MVQTLKEQIYHTEDANARVLARMDRDSSILPENKEAIKQFLNDKAAEGVPRFD